MQAIDLNADLGEGCGDDAAMLDIVSSANIACGGHAGDKETMIRTARLALKRGVAIGAHPGFPDKENFGRKRLDVSMDEIHDLVVSQVRTFAAHAHSVGASLTYLKLHGALANWAAQDEGVADTVVAALDALSPMPMAVLAISGSTLEQVARDAGRRTFSEIFADRGYTPDGQLVPRGSPEAVIERPDEARARLEHFFDTGEMPTAGGGYVRLSAHSICVHGDSENAIEMARAIRRLLEARNIAITPFAPLQANV
ncbi:MAG: 5-oxoprolinase subunit PxpA [Pseudomonadota bacterium]